MAKKNSITMKDLGVVPGEAAGMVGAQSIGEPSTQMVLGTLHSAGTKSVVTTVGLPRMIELVDARKKPKSPMMHITLEKAIADKYEKVREIWRKLEEVKVRDVTAEFVEDFRTGSMMVHLNKEELSRHEITPRFVAGRLSKREGIEVTQEGDAIKLKLKKKENIRAMRTSFVNALNFAVVGISGIAKALIEKEDNNTYSITTSGSNVEEVMKIDGVEKWNVYSNDVFEILRVYGIEAARNLIANEVISTIREEGLTVSFRHVALLADAMTYTGEIRSAGRHGIAGDKDSVFARAAYEETVKHFINASVFGERDMLKGVAENILIGKQIGLGTGKIKLSVKKDDLKKLKAGAKKEKATAKEKEKE